MDDDELTNCDKSDEFELEEDKEVIPDDMDEDCKDESTEVSPDTKPIINALIEDMVPGKWYIIERKPKNRTVPGGSSCPFQKKHIVIALKCFHMEHHAAIYCEPCYWNRKTCGVKVSHFELCIAQDC